MAGAVLVEMSWVVVVVVVVVVFVVKSEARVVEGCRNIAAAIAAKRFAGVMVWFV